MFPSKEIVHTTQVEGAIAFAEISRRSNKLPARHGFAAVPPRETAFGRTG